MEHLQSGEQDFEAWAAAALPRLAQESADKYARLSANVARQALADEAPVQDVAQGTTSFLIDGVTVVMRHEGEADALAFYADLGLPDPSQDLPAILGHLLEMNLMNVHPPGILFGQHPESKRLIAYFKGHLLMFDDEGDLCLRVLTRIVEICKSVRTW